MANNPIHIELSQAEALLLFEAVSKLDAQRVLDTAVSEEERSAIWALEAVLEKSLPVFDQNYAALVEAAKREIRGDAPSE